MTERLKELVMASREVVFGDGGPDSIKRLSDASEAFAADYEWDDEPLSLRDAVLELYLAGRWSCDSVPEDEQARMWEAVRDAAGISQGTATIAGIGA